MGIISWIILGLIAGFIGAKIVNREGQGFLARYCAWNRRRPRRRVSVCSPWSVGRHGLEHLQHDCRNRGRGGGAADLQCGDRASPSVMH
jgi:hypothetical protein